MTSGPHKAVDRDMHLSDSEIAGYLDGELQAGETGKVEQHLDACVECREALRASAHIIDSWNARDSLRAGRRTMQRGRWRVVAGAAGLAAASLAALLVVRSPVPSTPDAPSALRGPATYTEGVVSIPVVQPADGVQVSGAVLFVWRPAGTAHYRLRLVQASGAAIWTHDTADTTAALPPGIRLEPGRTYFWSVDAITDGVNASTRVSRFTVSDDSG